MEILRTTGGKDWHKDSSTVERYEAAVPANGQQERRQNSYPFLPPYLFSIHVKTFHFIPAQASPPSEEV